MPGRGATRILGSVLLLACVSLGCEDQAAASGEPNAVDGLQTVTEVPQLDLAPLPGCTENACPPNQECVNGVCSPMPAGGDAGGASAPLDLDSGGVTPSSGGGNASVSPLPMTGFGSARAGNTGDVADEENTAGGVEARTADQGDEGLNVGGDLSNAPRPGGAGAGGTETDADDDAMTDGSDMLEGEPTSIAEDASEEEANAGGAPQEAGGAGSWGGGADSAGAGGTGGSGGSETGPILCTDTCALANDETCQDGGPGSHGTFCPYGTDCVDCGPRVPGNYCPGHNRDCDCDDGRTSLDEPPQAGSVCAPYSDESDCGQPQSENPACSPCISASECRDWGEDFICHQEACSPPRCTDDRDCPTGFCSPDGYCDGMEPSPRPDQGGHEGGNQSTGGAGGGGGHGGASQDRGGTVANGGSAGPSGTLGPTVDPPPHPEPEPLCSEICPYSGDGDCDDGGPRTDYLVCDYGTDCVDCGERPIPSERCVDHCRFANNGECDDGGPNAHTSACALGSDCADCGVRGLETDQVFCSNACVVLGFIFFVPILADLTNDGICDDGGPDSDDDPCTFGSDCADCGPR